MDLYTDKPPDSHRLIRILFGIMGIVLAVVLALLFVLNLHEKIAVKDGEIISEESPVEYVVPFDAEVGEVLVAEGDRVEAGDTLVSLYNSGMEADQEQIREELALVEGNIAIYKRQISNFRRRIRLKKDEIKHLSDAISGREEGGNLALKALEDKLTTMRKKMNISKARIKKDKELLDKGAINEREYSDKYKKYLDERTNYTDAYNSYMNQKLELKQHGNSRASVIDQHKMEILDTENEYSSLKKLLQEEESMKARLERRLESEQTEMDKQYIVAEKAGIAAKLFNLRKEVRYVSKGQPLVTLLPVNDEGFQARLAVPEKSVKDIEMGQLVHIKVEAYNHYKYGVLKGEVTHLDRDIDNNFYILATVRPDPDSRIQLKNGYKVKGEVIVKEVKLYEYILNSMFKKIEV